MKRIFTLLLALFFGLFANAQWPTNPNVNKALTILPSVQASPIGISDGNNGAIIAWEDMRSGNSDIFAQKIDQNGTVSWLLNGVPVCTASGHQTNLHAIEDGFGGAFLIWEDERTGDRNLYAQRLDGNGVALWNPDGILITAAPGEQLEAKLVLDPAGFVFITWTDQRGGAGSSDIYGQKLDFNGNKFWFVSGQPICKWAGRQTNSSVQPDGAGSAIFTWIDERNGQPMLYADRMLLSGFSMWMVTGKPIAGQVDVLSASSVLAGNQVLIPYLSGSLAGSQLRVQRLDLAGNLLLGAMGTGISSPANTLQNGMVDFASDGVGGMTAVWADIRNGNSDLYLGRIRQNGSLPGPVGGTQLTFLASDELNPSISEPNCDGSAAIVTWEDGRNASQDVYAQRADTTLIGLWTMNGVPLSTAGNSQTLNQHALVNADNGIIGYWRDFRTDADGDVYCQAIDCNGNLPANLPVNMSYFGGVLEGETVLLSWGTGSELNNDFFQVERSLDGKSFETIGFHPATGAGSDYELIDEAPEAGTNFYRLRQVDYDGSFIYTSTVAIEIGANVSLKMYPNPTIDRVSLSGIAPMDAASHAYKVLSLSGQVLQKGQLSAALQIEVSGLPAGMYIMQVTNVYGQQVFAERLVKGAY